MPKSRRRPRAADPARLPVSPPELEGVVEADRRFFERHPGRSHRIRLMGLQERAQGERGGQRFDPPFPGFAWFTAVRQVAPGARVRVFFQSPALCETDVSESFARELYERAEGQNARVLTARMVRALRAAGAPLPDWTQIYSESLSGGHPYDDGEGGDAQ